MLRFLDHTHIHTHTHKHTHIHTQTHTHARARAVGLLQTGGQPVAETSTYRTPNKHEKEHLLLQRVSDLRLRPQEYHDQLVYTFDLPKFKFTFLFRRLTLQAAGPIENCVLIKFQKALMQKVYYFMLFHVFFIRRALGNVSLMKSLSLKHLKKYVHRTTYPYTQSISIIQQNVYSYSISTPVSSRE